MALSLITGRWLETPGVGWRPVTADSTSTAPAVGRGTPESVDNFAPDRQRIFCVAAPLSSRPLLLDGDPVNAESQAQQRTKR